MVATVPLHHPHFLPIKPYLSHHRSANSPIHRPSPSTVRAFSRSDFEGFARRVSSGEALRDALRSANEGIEQLTFEVRLAAERLDRRYAVSNRIGSAARAAVDRAREIDLELGIGRRWRSFSMDFSRNLPRYRKELSGFLGTPIGRGSMPPSMVTPPITLLDSIELQQVMSHMTYIYQLSFRKIAFFLWFALSGWWFRFFIIATWVLPFAALLIRIFANSFAIKGACPACKRQFVGYRNQVIRCAGCRNIVWQPGSDFSNSSNNTSSSKPYEADIIDIEIEEK